MKQRMNFPTWIILAMLAGNILILHLLIRLDHWFGHIFPQPFTDRFIGFFVLTFPINAIPVLLTVMATLILVRRIKWPIPIFLIELTLLLNAFLQGWYYWYDWGCYDCTPTVPSSIRDAEFIKLIFLGNLLPIGMTILITARLIRKQNVWPPPVILIELTLLINALMQWSLLAVGSSPLF